VGLDIERLVASDPPLTPGGRALAEWLYGDKTEEALARPLLIATPLGDGGAVMFKHPVGSAWPQGYPYDFIWPIEPGEHLPAVVDAGYAERFAIGRALRLHGNVAYNLAALRRTPGSEA